MTDEEEAFIAGVEMGIDWNLYIPPSDHARYDYLIWQQNRKEEVKLDRLTYKGDDGAWGLLGVSWAQIDTKTHPELYGALWKLKDYEDIGLNPDQVERLDGLYLEKCKEVNELQELVNNLQEVVSDQQAKLKEYGIDAE